MQGEGDMMKRFKSKISIELYVNVCMYFVILSNIKAKRCKTPCTILKKNLKNLIVALQATLQKLQSLVKKSRKRLKTNNSQRRFFNDKKL